MNRVPIKTEPKLLLHRYVITIGRHKKDKKGKKCWHTQMKYAMNREEARDIRAAAPKGSYIEVFKASTEFLEAWQA